VNRLVCFECFDRGTLMDLEVRVIKDNLCLVQKYPSCSPGWPNTNWFDPPSMSASTSTGSRASFQQ
jgi:hypothetical protein